MITAFKKASIQGKGTPQEVSDFRENHFNQFIAKYFPFPHRITKAIINDSYGNQSDSIDTVLIGTNHPYTIDSSEKFSLVLADGVDAAIELKPDLSTKLELVRGLKQIESVKKLKRVNTSIALPRKTPSHIIEFSKTIPSFIFCIKANANPIDTAKKVIQHYIDESIPIENQIDYIIINDVGIIANYKYPELSKETSKRTGFFFEEWKDLTLPAFLLKINESYPSEIRMSTPILSYYTSGLNPYSFTEVVL